VLAVSLGDVRVEHVRRLADVVVDRHQDQLFGIHADIVAAPCRKCPPGAEVPSRRMVEASILQVITDTDRRGAQVFATDLHDELIRRGRSVRTVALAPGAVGGLDVAVLGRTRTHPTTLRALRREAAAADVVVAHGSTTLPMCAATRLVSRTPFVYRQISDSRFWAPNRARRLRVRAGLAAAARIVTLWSGSADTLRTAFGVSDRKLRIVPNGVPSARALPIDRSRAAAARREFALDPEMPTVLSIGALVTEKGVDLAVTALGAIEGAQLLIAGDGPERGRLERLARQQAPGRIVFAGSITDPRPAFTAADVVVLPSRGGDSMPAVLIEAGLMGLPVVATPVGGIVDIVESGVTGILVPPDAVDPLRAALVELLADPERAVRLGDAAHQHCTERFSIEVVASGWERVLDEVAPA
jgi:glycosyltransferase involved in cell wall biosynthesis